ncbi:hypothetical protein FPRO05_08034 [Fusarium proliferatum]|uniref:RNase III domain-containing protein n=1 Tax=Gibberella intermedia TaxID=948311 RepID=A0A365NIC5_GIBIN|nr:hypothetical protein FPRO05_08034 [Fusarium proliferatum]
MTSCPRFSRKVAECESIITYEFNSKSLCAQALNAAADSMAFTATLQLQPTCAASGSREDSRNTTLRRDLISNDKLTSVGRERGLHKCINMNGGTTRVSSGMVATAVEAILGAVEMDGGRDALARVMKHLGLTEHALLGSVKLFPFDNLTPLICIGAFAAAIEFPRDIDL